jgi:transcriptional regulator with XRE-family HTH domain
MHPLVTLSILASSAAVFNIMTRSSTGQNSSSGEAVNTNDTPALRVGKNLRTLRRSAGLSVNRLAVLSAVSAGMISQIERDQANPSLKILERLRAALNGPLSALLETADLDTMQVGTVVRRLADRPVFKVGRAPLIKEMLSPAGADGLRFMTIRFPPRSSSEEVVTDPGQKAGLVLEGQIQLAIGSQRIDVSAGDSFQFDSTLDHSVHNLTDKDALVLWIIAPQIQIHL